MHRYLLGPALSELLLTASQVEEDRARFLQDQEDFKRSHRTSWEVDVQEKQRFTKLAEDKAAFEEAVKSRRAADFAALQVRIGSSHPHCTSLTSFMPP